MTGDRPAAAEPLPSRARQLIAAGRGPQALGELVVAFARGEGDIEAAQLMSRLLSRYQLEPAPQVGAALDSASRFDDCDLQPLFRSAADVWLAEPAWKSFAAAPGGELQRLIRDRLRSGALAPFDDRFLHRMLARTIFHDVTLERILTAVRRELLFAEAGRLPAGWTDLAAALAAHGGGNEYAWFFDEEEAAALERLAAQLAAQPVPRPSDAVRVAMYRPWPPKQPEAGALQEDIGRLGGPPNPASAAIHAQYEENPYPRWLALNPPEPGERRSRLQACCSASERGRFEGAMDVLIAGCGTGRQAIAAAVGYGPTARVLAIDLSRASLAYAARMAEHYGVTNIRFLQADILDLDRLGQEFDVIEAIGVLHHLADPISGWRIVARRLRSGGLMGVGLYSERGRQDVVAARQSIAALGLPPTAEGIRELRRMALDAPADAKDWRVTVRRFVDFFSLSGCRDLLFNAQEHRFTPLQVRDAVAALGLELRSVEAPPSALVAYRARHPSDPAGLDLAAWDRFEIDHPSVFAGMIRFWCRKPD